MSNFETCSVVNGSCDSPASAWPEHSLKSKCFACGQEVCGKCSGRRLYLNYGVRRICDTCIEDLYEDGEAYVRRKAYRNAGYKGVTMAQVRKELSGRRLR